MKLICKQEALNNDGTKTMEFTKGVVYQFKETDEGDWESKGDDGKKEEFWNLDIMFTSIT